MPILADDFKTKFMLRSFDTFKYIAFLVPVLFLSACRKPDAPKPESVPVPLRTVIVYMAADNDLYNNAVSNINDMEAAMGDFAGNLIVYIDPPSHAKPSSPYIMEIRHDESRTITSPTVKTYPEQNSASGEVMERVIEDIVEMYPADGYGLVLWSHGTGWLPSGTYGSSIKSLSYGASNDRPQVKTFARDNLGGMEISDLAKHLPVKFDFILFDVCLMAGIETLYEIRNSTDYIVASAAEILAEGFPYDKTTPCFFGVKANLSKAAQKFMEHYNSLDGAYRSATISVVKTAELDALMESVRQLVKNKKSGAEALDKTSIQKYDRLSKTIFFDLENFVERLCPDDDLSVFRNRLSKAVIYKGHTPRFLNEYDIVRSCGLSCYIPSTNATLDEAYAELEWAKIWN